VRPSRGCPAPPPAPPPLLSAAAAAAAVVVVPHCQGSPLGQNEAQRRRVVRVAEPELGWEGGGAGESGQLTRRSNGVCLTRRGLSLPPKLWERPPLGWWAIPASCVAAAGDAPAASAVPPAEVLHACCCCLSASAVVATTLLLSLVRLLLGMAPGTPSLSCCATWPAPASCHCSVSGPPPTAFCCPAGSPLVLLLTPPMGLLPAAAAVTQGGAGRGDRPDRSDDRVLSSSSDATSLPLSSDADVSAAGSKGGPTSAGAGRWPLMPNWSAMSSMASKEGMRRLWGTCKPTAAAAAAAAAADAPSSSECAGASPEAAAGTACCEVATPSAAGKASGPAVGGVPRGRGPPSCCCCTTCCRPLPKLLLRLWWCPRRGVPWSPAEDVRCQEEERLCRRWWWRCCCCWW
jgi:hypothetical protein